MSWLMKVAITSGEFIPPWANQTYPFMVWLTSWAFVLLNVHLFLALLLTVYHNAKRGRLLNNSTPNQAIFYHSESDYHNEYEPVEVVLVRSRPRTPFLMKLSWLVFAVISNGAIIVSIVYFAALFPQMKNPSLNAVDFHLHGMNSIVILLDMIVTSYPVHLLHMIYPAIFGILYVLFSVFYWLPDHDRVLYPKVLDWNHPGQTMLVVCILLFVAVPLIQLFLYAIFKLRVYMANKCCHIPDEM